MRARRKLNGGVIKKEKVTNIFKQDEVEKEEKGDNNVSSVSSVLKNNNIAHHFAPFCKLKAHFTQQVLFELSSTIPFLALITVRAMVTIPIGMEDALLYLPFIALEIPAVA